MRLLIFVAALNALLMGCAGETEEVPVQNLTEWQQLSVALKPEPKTGDKEAFGKLAALVKAVPEDVMLSVDTAHGERVAGQKANLVAYGQTFEEVVRKLVEGEDWVIELSTEGSVEERLEKDIRSEEMAGVKKASKLLLAYAEVVEEGGNPELAARACLTNRMLGRQMLQTDHLLMTNLVAVAVNAIAERGIRMMAIGGYWSSDDMILLQGKGWDKRQAVDGLVGSVKSEWWNFTLPLLSSIEFPNNSDRTMRLLDESDKNVIEAFRSNPKAYDRKATIELGVKYLSAHFDDIKPGPMQSSRVDEFIETAFGEIPEDGENLVKWAKSTENGVGISIVQMMFPFIGSGRDGAMRSEASQGLSEVVLAAQRGLIETGSLPGSYEELAKFGLPEGVVDPFSGKAFGYDPVRGLAWSVGLDGVDDGGTGEAEKWNSDAKDWVVRLK